MNQTDKRLCEVGATSDVPGHVIVYYSGHGTQKLDSAWGGDEGKEESDNPSPWWGGDDADKTRRRRVDLPRPTRGRLRFVDDF